MTISRSLRAIALLLALLTIFSLCGCAATRPVRASSIAQRAVATAGGLEIPYENLYYITMTRIAELKATYGEQALDDPTTRAELEAFVWANLVTKNEALLALAGDYGLSIDKGNLGDAVQEEMDILVEGDFGGDRKAYIKALNEGYLTDSYLRTYFAVSEHLASAIVEEMVKRGEINTSDDYALQVINGDSFIRTIQVFIDKNNGMYTEQENLAHITEISRTLAAIEDDEARYQAMCKAIGGKYNRDFSDALGNGYYFAKGEMEQAYEQAAFALDEYGVSDVVETVDGYYVIMRLPKSADYITKNFTTLKQSSFYVALNDKVDARLGGMTMEKTKFGSSLDLFDLPALDANGGETVLVVVAVAVGAVLVGGVVFLFLRMRRKGGKVVKARK